MVEIARAFTVTEIPARLVILDEPTSSLDAVVAEQLLAFVRRFVVEGGATILISHLLGEILGTADRVVVMRDGTVVEVRPANQFTRDSLVASMGSVVQPGGEDVVGEAGFEREGAPRVRALPPGQSEGVALEAYPGEIVGLAGLQGHGQAATLNALFQAAGRQTGRATVKGTVAMVAGDRQNEGILPLWSIARNITIGSLGRLVKGFLIDTRAEGEMAAAWRDRIRIRTPSVDESILSLSGGNQQKALFARALAAEADVVLMDDPMRGVDIGTKREVYNMIRDEAARGRTFVWYTTELDELEHCDHVYVFRDGCIVADLQRAEVTEERVLHSSFEGVA
jgi:ribose transport system ATP-binding protein